MNQQEPPTPSDQSHANGIEWLTAEEAAQYIKVHPRTIHKLVKRKQLPAFLIGRALRFRKSDINAYMEHHPAN
jgi:excisionase family DNA binding protein